MISLRHRLSPALVVALLSLFIALGGTGYAAIKLSPNSVGTRQLKNGAVTKKKIAKRTIKSLRSRAGVAVGTVAGNAPTPPQSPNWLWQNSDLKTPSSGSVFVLGHVESATVTCSGTAACSIDLGLYVDGEPVAHTDRTFSSHCSSTPCRIHVPQQDVFGIATGIATGKHSVQMCSKTRAGTVTAVSDEGGEIGAVLLAQ